MEKKEKILTVKKGFEFRYNPSQEKGKIWFRSEKRQSDWSLAITKDLELSAGFIAIMGPSGSGKSTLASILGGIETLSPLQGKYIELTLQGKTLSYSENLQSPLFREHFGYIFQRCYESKPLSALDNIALPLYLRHYPKKEIQSHCQNLLELLQLDDLSSSSAHQLSGGQLSRIGILRGFAQNPKIIIADEPASDLDEENAKRIMDVLKTWQIQTGGTVIMVSHHKSHAFDYADQIVLMNPVSSTEEETLSKKELSSSFYTCTSFQRKGEQWQKEQVQQINNLLALEKVPPQTFPLLKGNREKKEKIPPLSFFHKIAFKNLVTPADGSLGISMITLVGFFLLFLLAFGGNQLLTWLEAVDHLKNNSQYLKRFEVVASQPGLSKEVRTSLNNITTEKMLSWYEKKLKNQLQSLQEKAKELKQIAPHLPILPAEALCGKTQSISRQSEVCHPSQESLHTYAFLQEERGRQTLTKSWEIYRLFLDELIKKHALSPFQKKLKELEREAREMLRLESFSDAVLVRANLEKTSNQILPVAALFPRRDAGPIFVKKDGKSMDRTTTIRWVDYRDPILKKSSLSYLVVNESNTEKGEEFSIFSSNGDEGIILDKETLVDDLGYDLKTQEIKVDYGIEKTCVPIKAVIERTPLTDDFQALTTYGFGEKLRAQTHHCADQKRYFQIQFSISPYPSLMERWEEVRGQPENMDEFGNQMFRMYQEIGQKIEFETEDEFSKTKNEWENWLKKWFPEIEEYKVIVEKDQEFIDRFLEEAFFASGTVYAVSKEIVPALGWYIYYAYREDPEKEWSINAFDYEDKIKFAKQSETLLNLLKQIGFWSFSLFFTLFLSTIMLVTIRNKATEIAIFRAMGGSLWVVWYIYFVQMLILLLSPAITVLMIIYLMIPYAQMLFNNNIIRFLWKNAEEQRIAQNAISSSEIGWSRLQFFIMDHSALLGFSLFITFCAVTTMIIWIKYNHPITKILKER